MIVERMVFNLKPGKVTEAVDLIRKISDYGLPDAPHGMRVYWPNIASYDQVVLFHERWSERAETGGQTGYEASVVDPG